jgi:hypothetical protein
MYELNKKHRAGLAAVAAVACIGLPASAQTASAGEVRQVLPSLQVVRDAATGRLRAPTHEEIAAQAAAASQQRNASGAGGGNATMASVLGANHPLVQRSASATAAPAARMGAVAKRTDISKMHYSVATRGANGHVDTTCVGGESAAEHALHSGANTAKGARDEQ